MKNFSKIKANFFNQLLESYINDNKEETKRLLKILKENKNFNKLYFIYEEIDIKTIDDIDIATEYVNEISNYLKGMAIEINSKDFNDDCEVKELFEHLDILVEKDNFKNIDKKLIAKKMLVEHLTKPKEVEEITENVGFEKNEQLLCTVLVNNFNSLYENILSEEEKDEFKNIMNIPDEDIEKNYIQLKENVLNNINKLLTESTDATLTEKLQLTKEELDNLKISKYSYYKLKQLESGF